MTIQKEKFSQKHILFIGSVWPEPASSAGGSRTVQLMNLFLEAGWQLTFTSTATDSDHMINFSEWNVSKVSIRLNDASFDAVITRLNPDVVLFDKFMIEEQFGWRVAKHCPGALRILDTIDLHCLRIARQKAVKENRSFEWKDLLQEDVAKREIASIYRSDISLMISPLEMDLLRDYFRVPDQLLYYLPFLLEPLTPQAIKNWKPWEERTDFVTIGNFLHAPNWDAVLFLKQKIWPIIRNQLPDASLQVYGSYCTAKAEALHAPKDGFFIRGRATDAMQVMSDARICLAPLRFGAGIKGKLIEAMQCGTPSITTTIGAEGMHGQLEWNGRVEDDPEGFAKAAIELYIHKEKWEAARQNGPHILQEIYPGKELGRKWLMHLLQIQETLSLHRLGNFTGSMLMHHRLASTRYLSKWIEEKNRKL
jgi:glycosyltransferase involved in cell wall biosynthesis